MAKTRELLVKILGQDAELQKTLNRSQKSLQKFGKATRRLGADLTTYVTAPIGALGAAILHGTNRSADFADEIDKTSIRSGLAREQLQELGFAADQLGADMVGVAAAVESLTRRVPQLEKDTGDVAAAWRSLGINLRDSDGQLRKMDSLLPEIIGSLGKMQNETERNAIATQLFGRRAFELVPLFEAGSEGIEALTQRARELGLVVSDDAVAALVEYKDIMAEVKLQLAAVAARTATALLPVTQAVVEMVRDNVVPALQSFADWLGSISTETKKTVAIIAAVVAAIGPLTLAIGGVAAMIAFMLTPAGLMILALMSLSTIAVTVARNWDVLKLQGVLAWTALKAAAFDAVDGILGLVEKLAGWVPGLGEKIRGLRNDFDQFAEKSLAKSAEKIYELEGALGEVEPAAERVSAVVKDLSDDDLPDLNTEVDKVTKAIRDLAENLQQAAVMSELLGKDFDLNAAQASAYEAAVRALVAAGVDLDTVVGAQGETLRDLANTYLDLEATSAAAADAERMRKSLMEEGRRVTESLLTPQEEYAASIEALKTLLDSGSISQDTFNRGVVAAKDALASAEKKASDVQAAMENMASGGLDAVLSFATGSKSAVADFAKSALRDLLRVLARAALLRFVIGGATGGVGGFFASALGAPGRAVGGPVMAGRPYWVGERGPELVVPRQSSTVVPNHALGGVGNGGITLEFNVPPAPDPMTWSRDAQWQRTIRQTLRIAEAQGFKLKGS